MTDSEALAKAVQAELEVQIPQLPRAAIARASVDDNGKIIVCTDLHKAIEPATSSRRNIWKSAWKTPSAC